jgi:hypothetical protein|tara:strand:- start:576 stop:797 length:222 start_codon:yes stop_codon:yes gene_type:complete
MEIALVVLVVIGAFILGLVTSWLAKGYVEDYIENAAYAKSIVHPEMLDEDGMIVSDDLLYIRNEIVPDEDDED